MSTNYSEFDILFHNFFHPSSGYLAAEKAKHQHPLNIFYTDDSLQFEVACTGLTKEDVMVDIEDDVLKISYNKPEEEPTIHPGTIHRGLSKRSFDLGYKISAKYDLSKADAKLENGLLEIIIPISDKAKPKSLKIK
jgi:HSP20 family molecular chaperone IbpA